MRSSLIFRKSLAISFVMRIAQFGCFSSFACRIFNLFFISSLYCVLSEMASNESEIVEINDSVENIVEQNDDNEQSEGEAANISLNSEDSAQESDASEDDESAGVVGDDIPFEFTVGMKTNSKLIFTTDEKQLYRREKRAVENSYYYRCNTVNCKARLFYNAEQNKCSRRKLIPHTHQNQEKTVKVAKLRKIIQDECAQMAGSSKRNKTSVAEIISTNIRK